MAAIITLLTVAEIDLLLEALQARASRHDSMSRANPRGAGPHDKASEAMQKLKAKLTSIKDRAA